MGRKRIDIGPLMQLPGGDRGHILPAALPVADIPSIVALRALPFDIGLAIE